MISTETISQVLSNFTFVSYAKVTQKLLSAYGIVESTINRIVQKISNGENGPFYVYRRAVIYCIDDDNYENAISKTKDSLPLSIVFQSTQIVILNKHVGSITCSYEEVVDHLDLLEPLRSWDINRNDHYSTLELDSLVESLYNCLVLDGNKEDEVRRLIFSLLYIAHFRTLLSINEVDVSKRSYTEEDSQVLYRVFRFFRSANCPFVEDNTEYLSISKEAYKYIFSILRFDTSLVDAEVLTSLIYKITAREEAGLYGHKTSFVNVEKLLQPMFLEEMQKRAKASTTESVFAVVNRIYDTVIFDPTNGPGCYLVAAYNGLLQQLRDIEVQFDIRCRKPLDINNFVALVENELTKELTTLALVFTHTQELSRMGLFSMETILEMEENINVYVGNELSTDWNELVTPSENLYVVGSPQFRGANKLEASKKTDVQSIFGSKELFNADYCSAWLVKAAQLIGGTSARAAFVLTNSVSQGTQATFILNKINECGCEYAFAYQPFKWKINSADNSAVTVVVIGIASQSAIETKTVYNNSQKINCSVIGANLLPNVDIRLVKRSTPISKQLPHIRKGNMPDNAAGILTFSSSELDLFLEEYPDAVDYIKPLYGGEEFVNGSPKYCLWISDNQLADAIKIKGIEERINQVRIKRCSPNSSSLQKSRNNPHKFRETFVTSKGKISVVIPCVTSESRQYLQMGILDSSAIINNNALVYYDGDIWLLALLESKMHLLWVNLAGKHEQRPRYSAECYNTFPVPELSKKQIGTLRNLARTLLEVRERYCDKSLAQLYKNMPPELVRVHQWIDNTVDSFYRSQPFESDGERLVWLQNLYNNMLANE